MSRNDVAHAARCLLWGVIGFALSLLFGGALAWVAGELFVKIGDLSGGASTVAFCGSFVSGLLSACLILFALLWAMSSVFVATKALGWHDGGAS